MPAIESIVNTTPYLQNLKKSMDPLTLGAGLQGVIGLGKSIFGGIQAGKARERLRQLERVNVQKAMYHQQLYKGHQSQSLKSSWRLKRWGIRGEPLKELPL